MHINKKWWFGVLMLLIFMVGLSIASVNAEGGSHEVNSDATDVVPITQEEADESLRQHGVSEEVIQALRELDSRLDQLHTRGASDEEAETLINEFNLRIQQIQQLQQHDKGTKSFGNRRNVNSISIAPIRMACAPWAKATAFFNVDRGPWLSHFREHNGRTHEEEGIVLGSSERIISYVGFNGGEWDYHVAAGFNPRYHDASCYSH